MNGNSTKFLFAFLCFFIFSCDKIKLDNVNVAERKTASLEVDGGMVSGAEKGLEDESISETGKVTGIIQDALSKQSLADVDIIVIAKGKTITTQSEDDGSFSVLIQETARTEGFTVQFSKKGYQNATRATIFELQKLWSELGFIFLYPEGSTPGETGIAGGNQSATSEEQTGSGGASQASSGESLTSTSSSQHTSTDYKIITGKVLDNFSTSGLAASELITTVFL